MCTHFFEAVDIAAIVVMIDGVVVCQRRFRGASHFRNKRKLVVVLSAPSREHVVLVDVVSDGLAVDILKPVDGLCR